MVPIFMVSMVPKDKNTPKFKSFTLYRLRLMNPEFEEIVKLSRKPEINNQDIAINLNRAIERNLRVSKMHLKTQI